MLSLSPSLKNVLDFYKSVNYLKHDNYFHKFH